MTNDEAIGIGLATLGHDTPEENLKTPTVGALLRQRTAGRLGFGLLLTDFVLQAVAIAV